MKRYFQCWKCGAIIESESDQNPMCVASAPYRTSGICGGGSIEITKDEYDKIYKKLKI